MAILIVDDSRTARMMIRERLEREGYAVLEANSGEEALTMLSATPVELVTLDLEMPGIDGFETCRRMRALNPGSAEKLRFLPVVMLTSIDSVEGRMRGFEYGCTEFVKKSNNLEELVGRINELLHPKSKLSGARVLIADDSSISRTLLAETLTAMGVAFDAVTGGVKALEILSGAPQRYTLLISAAEMPELSGVDLTRRIRSELGDNDLPILLLTANAERYPVMELFRSGASDYLAKPFVKEELMARVRAQLERQIMVRELQASRDAAEETTRAKAAFLANMSHEIRTPMNGIICLTRMVLETSMSDEQRDLLWSVQESAESLLHIINDILDYSKVEAGKVQLEEVSFRLPHLIEQIVTLLRGEQQKRSVEIIAEVSNAPEWVMGDPFRLRQVLLNLLTNALKFTPQGGVIMLQARSPGATGDFFPVEFSVIDTGIGIPNEKLSDIFNPYTQADSSICRNYGGTGLGLTISANLVRLMGGTLAVRSLVDAGTCFCFSLPLRCGTPQAAELVQKPLAGTAEAAAASSLRILVAEDNAVNQKVVRRLLEKEGYEFRIVEDGVAVLEALAAETYDVILMDIQMPKMGGIEATRAIRASELDTFQHIPIVALTAHALAEEREALMESGMDDYLAKPIDLEALRRVLTRLSGPTKHPVPDSSSQNSRAR